MRNLMLVLCLSIIGLYGCQDGGTAAKDGADKAAKKAKDLVAEAMAATGPKKFTLTPFTPSPTFEDASLYGMSYVKGKFAFKVGGESYKLGAQTDDAEQKMCANSAKGQHIHLIVDNGPYQAKYEAEFESELTPGEHYLLAFISRSYHESIKSDKAHQLLKVNVADNRLTSSVPVTDPMVFYSRPKGTYKGKANTDKVMLDFYLNNADMSDGYKVLANINDETHVVDNWQPYYIEGLPMGENSITLTLVDEKGRKVDSPLNPVTRKFTLEQDPLEVQ